MYLRICRPGHPRQRLRRYPDVRIDPAMRMRMTGVSVVIVIVIVVVLGRDQIDTDGQIDKTLWKRKFAQQNGLETDQSGRKNKACIFHRLHLKRSRLVGFGTCSGRRQYVHPKIVAHDLLYKKT